DTSSPTAKSIMTVISVTACNFAPVHRRTSFLAGLCVQTAHGAGGPEGFDAMKTVVSRANRWPTHQGSATGRHGKFSAPAPERHPADRGDQFAGCSYRLVHFPAQHK